MAGWSGSMCAIAFSAASFMAAFILGPVRGRVGDGSAGARASHSRCGLTRRQDHLDLCR